MIRELPIGTRIEIHSQGVTYRGVVALEPARNYGDKQQPNWYIQFTHDSSNWRPGHSGPHGYWKQNVDGGKLVSYEIPTLLTG